jgi:competence protein ComEC
VRKLAYCCSAFAAAVITAHYAVPEDRLWVGAAFLAAAAAVFLLFSGRYRLLSVVLLSAAIGFGCCMCQYRLTLAPAEALAGKEMTVSARVCEFPTAYDDCTSIDVVLNGELPHVSARIYDYENTLPALRPGDEITLKVKFSSASTKYGEKSDLYFSRNIFAVGYAKGGCVITGRWAGAWLYFPQYASRAVLQAVQGAFPGDTAPFLKALLMGDKTDLYIEGDTYVSMRASGLIHVVAVSGLHVAFLVGFLLLIMGRNRRSSIVCITLVWLFVVMTGGSPSTVRAGVMQTMLLAAPLLKRENDSFTTLSFALAAILLFSPAEAGSAALQLSFAAMAGIMLFAQPIYDALQNVREGRALPRLRSYACSVLSSSVGAVVFTAPILALRFGYVPLLGPVTNILCLWAVTACFCGGFIACGAFAVWSALGRALGWLVSWFARYIFLITGAIAKIPFACAYTSNNIMSWWLVMAYAVFAVTYLGRRKDAEYRWVLPACLSAAALCAALIVSSLSFSSGAGYITALDVGQGQSIAVISGKSTVLIDCGGKSTYDNAGDTAAAYLLSRGRGHVDALILTHLHADHANGAVRLIQSMKVKTLVMPEKPNDDDGLLAEILSAAEKHGTEIKYIGTDSVLTSDGINVSVFAPPEKGSENERGLSMKVSLGSYDMLVTGDMNRTAEKAIISGHRLDGTELLIAGHHGSAYSTSDELLTATGAKTAIISVGYNSYGHPSNAALRRLWEAGAQVWRTDLNGNVTVRIG